MKHQTILQTSRTRFSLASRLFVAALVSAAFAPLLRAQITTVFTNSTTIVASNTAFDGQNIVINGCTVTVDGIHDFDSLSLSNGAVLTHQPTTTGQEYSLVLTVSNNLLVDASSSVNVSGRGYLPGYTLGNTNAGGATSYAGGSYAGLGGVVVNESANAVYGDYHNPDNLGSGSGPFDTGSAGGGLVQITAGSAHVDGAIMANGGSNGGGGGGGSGGGVLLNVGTLSGTGTIAANGGTGSGGDGGGGGGGRVAIYYGMSTLNLSSNVTAIAGPGDGIPGSVGTVYLQPTGGPGQLIINSHGTAVTQWTPLGAATDTVIQVDMLLVSGTNVVAAPEHQMAILTDSITITNGGELTQQPTTTLQTYSLELTATNNLVVDDTSSIDVSDRGYLPGYTLGNTNAGGATSYAGGSYGGLGGVAVNESANAVYGDYHNPDNLGSGSGPFDTGSAGGGLVQITAGSAQVNGAITANGGSNGGGGGGGSGGGVLLNVGTLSGTGTIAANGGTGSGGDGGGGGGGRVAIYYGASTFNLSSNVTAIAGPGGAGPGSVGTVYLQQAGQLGQLILNNHGAGTGSMTPLGGTTDVVFQADNLLISGSNIVAATASGCPIQANTMTILDGAVLTHQPTTASHPYSLQLTITNNLVVDAASRIDVSDRGYLPGYTLGNTNTGASTDFAGGSYGGLGGVFGNEAANAVYGDYHNPENPGSGSGSFDTGAAGGGLVQITAGSAQVDGAILANGGSNGGGGGGGSGGGVLLNVGTLTGQGNIAANGGNGSGGDGGGGSGGRVAIYYGSNTFNFSSNVTATGGHTTALNGAGAAGTVYFQQTGSPGQLVINNEEAATGQWTPLGQTNDSVFLADTLVLSGSGTAAATVSGAPIRAGSLSLVKGALLTHLFTTAAEAYSLVLTITNNLLVDGTSSINVSSRGYLAGYTLGNTNTGASTTFAGGSYGGLGGVAGNEAANAVYGDYRDPDNLGSGSGTGDYGSSGGGLVQITAATAQVDGAILATGGSSTVGGGGGSGGGVLLNVGTLSGAGTIAANGGTGNGGLGGGGSGGRVAIYYGINTFNLSSNVTAFGGHTTAPNGSGAAGTVYLQETGSPGQLAINNDGAPTGQWTPLGLTNDTVFVADTLVLSGSGTAAATVSGAPIRAGNLSLVNGALLTHLFTTAAEAYSLVLTITNNLLVDGTSSINVSSRGYLAGYTVGNTNTGAATTFAGGSYGGLGGVAGNGVANEVYGDYHSPDNLGSGSGTGDYGSSGGGLVQITAATAQVDGAILATGGSSTIGGGAGSGGGVLLNVGILSGAGTIAANGGTGNGGLGGGGSGGRVAIYYGTNTFNLSSNVTAAGGPTSAKSGAGAAGTVYSQQAGSPGQLVINNGEATTVQWTPLGQTNDSVFLADTVVLSGSGTAAATVSGAPIQTGNLSLINGALLTHPPTTAAEAYSLVVMVTNNLLVDGTSSINVSSRGYLAGYTLGNTNTGASTTFAGGSYGGLGGVVGSEAANAVYGDYRDPDNLGSGSGTGDYGSSGGGLVQITAATAQVDGAILATGGSSTVGGGGGSGGGVLLNVGTLSGAGTIAANGGTGSGGLGGGGGGGRVAIYARTAMNLSETNVTASGGPGGGGATGQNGSVYITPQPYLAFSNVPPIWHGVEQITFLSIGLDPNGGDIAEVEISKGGVNYFQQSTPTSQTLAWNTATVADGNYTLTVTVLTPSGIPLGQISQSELINNTLAWHEGTLASNETWGTNVVNAVDQTVIIPSGVTLTIAPGAIVKFAPGAGIIIQAGGILNASGATVGAPIVFTSLADASAGGDSELEGGNAVPVPGDWNGIVQLGQFNASAFVQVRYVTQKVGGTLTANQSWVGSVEYLITSDLSIPTNVTLTIEPGAIIKFNPGLNMTVQSGGLLIALGTVAQPIVFTSVNDQSIGAITNGASTTPAAGDWDSIYLKGGHATFDHVSISYGGGPDSLNSGLISIIAPGAILSVSDSILRQGFYKGIQAEYGTANVTNCLITGCDRGIQPGLNGPTVVNIINCTLDNNNVGIWAHGGVMNLANTIVSDSLTTGVEYCCGSSLSLLEYCDVWSATGANYSGVGDQTGVNGNISKNPMFVKAADGNFELNYGSPCINSASGAVAPLTDLLGAPCYNDPRTLVKTGVVNANGVYPDMGAFEFVDNAPSDIDLIAASVVGPTVVTAGQTVTVQWNDVNIGTGNATGPWHDTISLVPQNGNGPVVATVLVAQSVALGPRQSYAASASVVVPGGQEGAYQWQVQVNSRGDVFEGVNSTNNTSLSSAATVLADPALTIGGTSLTNLFTAAGQTGVFALVSPGGTFVLNVQGSIPACALNIYVGNGYVPTPSHFDFQSSQFDSPTASVTVPGKSNGTYYVVVYAASLNAPNISYTLSATPLAFALNSVSPETIANSGPVTLQILGSQLAVSDTYTLAGPGGTIAASSVQSPDPTVAYAIFNLGGAAAGLYSVNVAQPGAGGTALTLTNAVSAINVANASAAASLSLQLELPSAYRKTRSFDGTIVYRDAGEVDLPAPILILSSGNTAGMALAGTTNYLTSDIVLIGASFQGPAGTLTPEKSWTFDFSALTAACQTLPFSVNYITAGATNLINYTALEATLQPPGYCASTWSVIWTNFQAKAGPTWGGFVSLLDSYSAEMALTNAPGEFYLVPDVLAFAFAQLAVGGCTNGLSLYPPAVGSLTNINYGPSQGISCVQSADPNVKFSTGIGASDWVAAGDAITYTIEFANDTNASAPAQTVAITDALATNLNWSTLQLTTIAFNNVTLDIPPGVQTFSTNVNVTTDPNPVAVSASLNPSNGVLTWLMKSIDPVTEQLVTDPLAGFLPPDNAQGQGEGYVTYTIVPGNGLATGTQIINRASIVFDLNAAIATPTTTNLIDATPPTSLIAHLPATSALTFPVSWSGQDAGAGISSFDIYVSTDGGPWTPWLLDTTNTSALFTGVNSDTYAFYSVAYDEAGMMESAPIIPGASTMAGSTVVTSVPINITRSGAGNLTFTWSQGTLLQTTNLAGPWSTNIVSSPYIVAPTNSQMYFKLLEK